MFAAYEAAVVPLQLNPQSRQPDLNRKPAVYETAALPLRYDGRKWTTGNDPAPPVWKTGMLPITPCPHMPEIGTSNIFPLGRLDNGVDSPSLMGKEFSSRFQGSNLGPSACKADALPAELNRDRSRQRGLNPHSLRWQRSAIADFAMPAYGRRKCLFLSPLFSFAHPFC